MQLNWLLLHFIIIIIIIVIIIIYRLGVLFVGGGCGQTEDSDSLSQEVISAFRLVAKEKGELSALAWVISVNILIINII